MNRRRVETVLGERLGDDIDVALAVAEDDGVVERGLGLADQAAQRLALGPVIGGNFHNFLGDIGGRGGGTRNFDTGGIVEELVGEALDLRRHGGGVEQGLAGERQELADALHVRNEAHVQHPVGFVDHQDIDLGQHQPPALEMVEQAARRGNQHIDAAIQLLGLIVHRDAANEKRVAELGIFAVAVETFRHLVCQFAGRFQHQGAGHARLGAAARQHLDHRQGEAGGLSGTGLGDADQVAPFQHDRDALRLDRRGRGVAGVDHRLENLGGKAQAVKAAWGRRRNCACSFVGSGFRAGDRHLGRSTLLKRGASAAPKPGGPYWLPALMHCKIGRNDRKSMCSA